MVWSPQSAAIAYLDTVKLCKEVKEPSSPIEPESTQFLSALAAGMSAQHIVEVSPQASQSTVALAVAARQTGGRLVCILPQPESLVESKQVIEDSGLTDIVEFKVGDPYKLLPECENVDFSVVDCKSESYTGLLKLLDMNPTKSVVVANNLVGDKSGLGGELQSVQNKSDVRSAKHPIGKGMEVTMIGKSAEFAAKDARGWRHERKGRGGSRRRGSRKSSWVMKVDEVSGEEHLFRIPQSI
ncbi:uncharacterized protein LOC110020993 [Phalaenopsis equestris]|uniref:uncharacterized protein LOC110020993 n=1 Tax=Phalaenopsis equestris TaxID=78828 RepID=UPI0009E4AA4D|nr:uncharacterized protein LOC110020993 [Phalaenopsis equestris]